MFNKIRKLTLIVIITLGWVFSGFPVIQTEAAIGDIGHWRDSIGGQIPGTAFAPFDFDQEIRNDGIYTRPNNQTIELDEAGTYLVTAVMKDLDTSNNRYQQQARMVLTAGTGEVFTSYYTGYSRNNAEDTSWTRVTGVIVNASADAQIQIQRRRDTDDPTGGSIASASDVQVVRINPTNHGIYEIGGALNGLGGTTPNTVTINNIVDESNTAAIEGATLLGGNNITIKGDNKRYLVAWSVAMDNNNGTRTQRIGHLEYDGVDELPTRSYCYARNAANEYCGLGSIDIVETGTADRAIQVEVFRGPGIAADQGGADADGSLITDGNGQMIVLELPDTLEVFRSHDSVGLQTVDSPTVMNIARDLDFNDSDSFTKATDSAVDVTHPADIFAMANIWTARNDVGSGARLTSQGNISINNILQSTGQHGNYSRGNQGTTDTFALGLHPGGIYNVGTAGHDIEVDIDNIPGGGTGGTDRTQSNTLGFFAFNLDTLLAPSFEQSAYRFYDNDNSTDVGTPLAAQDTAATLTASGDAFRLRTLINISDANLRQNIGSFKLQFAERSGTCDAGFVGESYADVTASSVIAFNDNPTPADGDNLTANANDPINGANTIINQDYEELNNFTNSVSAVNVGQDGKWDFSLIDNTAPSNTSYCFRMVESDGTIFDTYTVIPEITTAAALQCNIQATGGTVTQDGDYKIHTFRSSDTFTVTSGTGDIEILTVAGGGGGAGSVGNTGRGGGGAGGVVYDAAYAVSPNNYSVTVGAGGAGGASTGANGANGGNSVFDTLTALGGGGGGNLNNNGADGGSGGGAGVNNTSEPGGSGLQPGSASGGLGSDGGIGGAFAVGTGGGGGGGATAAGGAGGATIGGAGGAGVEYSQFASVAGSPSGFFAGGGGASGSGGGGAGGIGGGAVGGTDTLSPGSGVANTGGGGGASQGTGGDGGDGGSGIVIARYLCDVDPNEQNINFTISNNQIGFDELDPTTSRYATNNETGSDTPVTAHSILASTNAANGYVIELDGVSLECQNCDTPFTIDAIGGTSESPNAGIEQFGLRANVTGTGTVSSPYATINQYGFDSANFPDEFATGLGDEDLSNYSLQYLADIDTLVPAGEYQAVLTFTMHATY